MITKDDRLKILDFGLAKLLKPVTPMTLSASVGSDANTTVDADYASKPKALMGTPPYMSPEQAEAKAVDVRSDIFSFGVVLYEMLSGQSAFRRDTWVSTLAAVLHYDPPPLRTFRPGPPAFPGPMRDALLTQRSGPAISKYDSRQDGVIEFSTSRKA